MDLAAWTPRALSVLRIVTGLLFLEHGTGKLLGFPPSDHAAPALFSLMGVQGLLELVGSFLILIGLFTRPVAFILAGDMAVAYFMAHAPKSFFPTINGGQLAILFCFVFLYLVFQAVGSGARTNGWRACAHADQPRAFKGQRCSALRLLGSVTTCHWGHPFFNSGFHWDLR